MSVPIYDIRNIKFKITPESIANISQLPKYQSGIADLNKDAVVTVGYCLNTFSYTPQTNPGAMPERSWALSVNIMFVLYHGMALQK